MSPKNLRSSKYREGHGSAPGSDLPLLVRFAAVGLGCASAYFALCYVCQSVFGWGAFQSSATAYVCCLGAGYSAQRSLTFRSDVKHHIALPRYAALHLGIALLTSAGTAAASRLLPTDPLYTAALATGLAGAASFVVTMHWIFPVPDDLARKLKANSDCATPPAVGKSR